MRAHHVAIQDFNLASERAQPPFDDSASVLFPEPDKPVNHKVNPLCVAVMLVFAS